MFLPSFVQWIFFEGKAMKFMVRTRTKITQIKYNSYKFLILPNTKNPRKRKLSRRREASRVDIFLLGQILKFSSRLQTGSVTEVWWPRVYCPAITTFIPSNLPIAFMPLSALSSPPRIHSLPPFLETTSVSAERCALPLLYWLLLPKECQLVTVLCEILWLTVSPHCQRIAVIHDAVLHNRVSHCSRWKMEAISTSLCNQMLLWR